MFVGRLHSTSLGGRRSVPAYHRNLKGGWEGKSEWRGGRRCRQDGRERERLRCDLAGQTTRYGRIFFRRGLGGGCLKKKYRVCPISVGVDEKRGIRSRI